MYKHKILGISEKIIIHASKVINKNIIHTHTQHTKPALIKTQLNKMKSTHKKALAKQI